MPESNYILGPPVITVEFSIEPALNALDSLRLINDVDAMSGFSEWTHQVAASLPPDTLHENRLIFDLLGSMFFVYPAVARPWPDLSAYIDDLAQQNPLELRDKMVSYEADLPVRYPHKWKSDQPPPTAAQLLDDVDTYLAFVAGLSREPVDKPLSREAHALLNAPPQLLERAVDHVRLMWRDVMADEWRRTLPMLQESAAAYQQQQYAGLTGYEAVRAVTGRDLRAYIDHVMERATQLVFIPSAHIGPYVGSAPFDDTLYVLFGARLPRTAQRTSSELSRAELLTRLNALADDTRLRILEMLTEHDELRAQDIIEQLSVSQSTVSRHLSQLSATGYITERRRDVAKCYSLNPDRVMDTLRALTDFLARKS